MISERDIAERFSATWGEIMPMLTSNFIRVFNESHVKSFGANPVPITDSSSAHIISEFAFLMAKSSSELDKTIDEVYLSEELLKSNFKAGRAMIENQHPDSIEIDEFNEAQIDEAKKLSINLTKFIKSWKSEDVEFSPSLAGYGFLSNCHADLVIADTLYEVKTVNRTFRSKDLKQLFLYLALHYASGESTWINAGLYNPRLDVFCKFNVDGLVQALSGGNHSKNVFRELLDSLVRDVQLDSNF